MAFALIKNGGLIVTIVSPGIPDLYEHGKTYDDLLAVELGTGLDLTDFAATNWYDTTESDEAERWKTMAKSPGSYYAFSNGVWYFDTNLFGEQVRRERNMRLVQSDWTILPDSALSDSKKAEWTTYRQQLRDFPSTIEDNITLLSQLVWPTAPS